MFGLRINLSKSGLAGINVHERFVCELAWLVVSVALALAYLGVPLRGIPRAKSS